MAGDNGTALAKVAAPAAAGALATTATVDLPSLFALAKALKDAQGFVPKTLRTEGEIVAAILTGQEIGLPPMVSLRSIHIVEGKPGLDASMQLALAKRAGIRHRWVADGSDGKRAELWMQRPGDEPHTQVYTIEDAKRAGIAGKQNWQRHTAAMLRARCISSAMRAYAPDVLGGPVYDLDELDDMREPATLRGIPRAQNHDGTPASPNTAAAAIAELREDPEMRERIDAANAAGAAKRDEDALLAAQLARDIEELDSPEALEHWCYHHGRIVREMHERPRDTLWRKLAGNKSSVAARLGAKPMQVREWLAAHAQDEAPVSEPPPPDVDGEWLPPDDGGYRGADGDERSASVAHNPDACPPMGKHRSTPWRNVPAGYLRWCRDSAENADLRGHAIAELARREADVPDPDPNNGLEIGDLDEMPEGW